MLSLFRRKNGKWHEVRWRNGQRDIYMALRFAADGAAAVPTVEKLPSKPVNDQTNAPESLIVHEVQSAVEDYNRKNLCALKVGAIRYRANAVTEAADHGLAARKLLNLL